jgi:quinol monooxygenase YgiN
MIVVAGTVRVRSDRRTEALRAAAAMVAATEAEPGCRRYRFYADLEDPDTFFLFEEWESEEALARHFQTEHMRVFRAELPSLLAGGADVRRYVVSSSSPMM